MIRFKSCDFLNFFSNTEPNKNVVIKSLLIFVISLFIIAHQDTLLSSMCRIPGRKIVYKSESDELSKVKDNCVILIAPNKIYKLIIKNKQHKLNFQNICLKTLSKKSKSFFPFLFQKIYK